MAQILKEDVKNRIVESAKKEFLQHGFDDASMRRIALHSKMTVGNLYRYFENKDELNLFIVKDTYSLIDKLVNKLTNGKLSVKNNVKNIELSPKKLTEIFDVLSEELVDIYDNHKVEFNILMMSSKLSKSLTDWFSNLINNLIMNYYDAKKYQKEVEVLSRSYAVSIFSGMKEIFKNDELLSNSLKGICKVYFRSYVSILENDLNKFLGE